MTAGTEKRPDGDDISRAVHRQTVHMTRFVRRGMVFELDLELDAYAVDVVGSAGPPAAPWDAEGDVEDGFGAPTVEHDGSTEGIPAVRARRSARDPTDQEREDHEICHEPYRAWCATRIAGRGLADSHVVGDSDAKAFSRHQHRLRLPL